MKKKSLMEKHWQLKRNIKWETSDPLVQFLNRKSIDESKTDNQFNKVAN